jgi:transcriptional regulator GlxA family with amidase domain
MTLPSRRPIEHRSGLQRKLSVAFVLVPNFTLLAFSAFVDTLRLAADDDDRSRPIQCDWTVLSPDMRPIRSSSGVEVRPTSELQEPKRFDYIVVVGGVLGGPPLARAVVQFLQQAARDGVALAGICTGSFVLAELGLLDHRRCCVSWFHIAEFQQRFAQVHASAEELYIIEGDRLTSAGGSSVIHLAAQLVERHCGKRHAAKALRIMIEEGKDPANAVQPRPSLAEKIQDDRLKRAMLLMERTIEAPVSMAFIASHVGMSVRQLERLFKQESGCSPSAFYVRLRLAQSFELVHTSRLPIAEIAIRCGFVSMSHFAQHFRRAYGASPIQLRKGGLDHAPECGVGARLLRMPQDVRA